jgi:hypothetical protein
MSRLQPAYALRIAHLTVGSVFLIGFLLSGQYMHWFLGHLQGMSDAPRMLYRSAHIYLLWSAMLNLALGLYVRLSIVSVSRCAQVVGSALILVGPLLLVAAFFYEASLNDLQRPFSRPAIYAAFAGMLAHAFASAYAMVKGSMQLWICRRCSDAADREKSFTSTRG